MTITLAPDPNPRRSDRGPQAKRHVGPYYGHDLRRVLAGEPSPSIVDRAAEWYASWLWPARALVVVGLVIAAATVAAWLTL